MVKVEAYYMKEIKKQKQKTQIRVFGHEYVYFKSGYACKKHAYAYTPRNQKYKKEKKKKKKKGRT